MSRELADGLAVTAMTVRMEVSIHATAGSFALSRQRARRPPRLEREFAHYQIPGRERPLACFDYAAPCNAYIEGPSWFI